ncbi:MAG TPA: hypothetical protein VN436_02740, partial [Holophaga sp.]|nr:hypothetical protein [Holophaga sp.]
MDLVVGVDIGGTSTSFGFVDRAGRLHAAAAMPTEARNPAASLVARLWAGIETARAGMPAGHRLVGVGIGAPNANHN